MLAWVLRHPREVEAHLERAWVREAERKTQGYRSTLLRKRLGEGAVVRVGVALEKRRVVVSEDGASVSLESAWRIENGEPMPGLLLIRPAVGTGEVLRAPELILECAQEGEFEGIWNAIPF